MFLFLFIHLFSMYLLSTYYVLDTVLSAEEQYKENQSGSCPNGARRN